ncbi:MAG TPA: PQQ-binding-like beta-propeller repeat protein [Myxococcales bacterium]|nr:PQQ-binding-like beta-propeller repeat protein [Myxococcales bacterium]
MRRLLAVAAALSCTSTAARKSPPDQLPQGARGAVLQHHADAARTGVYVDAALTRAAVRNLRADTAFSASYQGPVYAQPLYWDAGDGGQDLLLVVTERNEVIALDPLSGSRIWSRTLAAPSGLSELPCGNIDPLGITGTPVIDAQRKLLWVDAMTAGAHHRIYAVSLADGSVVGSPVDLDSAVPGFTSRVQNQRGALALVDGILYVPFSGHFGDCGNYAGWVVGIDTAGTRPPAAYHTGKGGGMWSVSGVASMAGSLFVATGNTIGLTTWNGGEAILRLAPGPAFSGNSVDYYAPADWKALDDADDDIGTSGAFPFDVGGAHFVATMGKNGRLYLADRDDLGGIGGGALTPRVGNFIVTAPAVIATPSGTVLAFTAQGTACPGAGNGLVGLRIGAGPPASVTTAWCALVDGSGSAIATTTGDGAESVIWVVGAEGDARLHAVNAETGEALFTGGQVAMRRFNAPIAAKGRIYAAGDTSVAAFTVR